MAKLSKDVLELMKQQGIAQYPKEACGLIIRKGRKSVALACENSADTPENRFRISALEYARCAKEGRVVGVWHTHTNESAEPSEADRSMCEGSGVPWYILAINKRDGEFVFDGPTAIDPKGYQTPYVGRPYVYGIHDCYILVCDYYQREFGIEMRRDYPRIESWWSKGFNFFNEDFPKEGFVSVSGQKAQPGDVFIIQSGAAVGNHVAVYIGNDQILHHCIGRLSTKDVYGGYWQKHTINHLRHKSKC